MCMFSGETASRGHSVSGGQCLVRLLPALDRQPLLQLSHAGRRRHLLAPDAGSRGSAAASRRLDSVTPRRAASSACCARTSSAAHPASCTSSAAGSVVSAK